jgi:putative membrane protein
MLDKVGDDDDGEDQPITRVHLGTQLSLKRTALAYDRTLMAWTRTGTSLISFGFSIYKFFDLTGLKPRPGEIVGPQLYGMSMIVTGLVSLAFASYDHRANMKALVAAGAADTPARARWVAGAVALLGLMAMAAVLFHE